MAPAPTPLPAVVRPRVFAPDTGELLPLDDALELWLAARQTGIAVIVGGAGSGKTTALSHLRTHVSDAEQIQFVDDADEDLTSQVVCAPLSVWSAASPDVKIPQSTQSVAFRLAPWQQDDWIEYLLAAHPAACGPVICRLRQAADIGLLGGNPELCRIVLDRMAADGAIDNVRAALRRQVDELFDDAELRAIAEDYAIEAASGTAKMREHVEKLAEHACGEAAFRLLRHDCIRNLLAAERIVRGLHKGRRRGRRQLARVLPRELIREIARQLDEPARRQLEDIQSSRDADCNAAAVSILVAADSSWIPVDRRIGRLVGAFVAGARWPKVDLSRSELSWCDLSGAVLEGANLDDSHAVSCNFANAVLVSTSASDAHFTRSCFNDARLGGMNARRANFNYVEAIACDFQTSQLPCTDFQFADLSRAIFCNADLSDANFRDAVLEETDFTAANLESANLSNLDLHTAVLRSACLMSARMYGCNLEDVDLPSANLRSADLCGAILTASRMPQADLREADLRETGLAEIEWEQADLRDADLHGATFHMGSSRSGLVDSYIASEGTRTGFYTDEYDEQHFKAPEEVRKANLCGADLRGAKIDGVDFYLVDLRGAKYSQEQRQHFEACGAILSHP